MIAGRSYYYEEREDLPTELTKEQFLKFVKYLPNLKKIELYSSDNITRYLKYLFDVDSNKYLTQIEEIYVTNHRLGDECEIYSDLYFKFRASIKHASIYHEPESFINSKYGGIINYLNQFNNLTHITYCNTTNEDIMLHQLQVSCPYLIKIVIQLRNYVPEHEAGTIGFYNSNSLKKLRLSFPYISASYIDLVTEQLPSSVDDLNITVNEKDIYDWIDTVGIGKVLKLIKRMCQLRHARFNFVPYKRYEVEYEDDKESFITVFYKLLHAFKENRKMVFIGNFNDFRSVHHHIDFDKGKLDFTYGMKYEDFHGQNEADERPVLDLAIPNKSTSIVGLDIMNVLVFHISKIIEGSTYKFLAYSLINCPNLQYVEYKAMDEPSHEFVLCRNPNDRHYRHYLNKLDPSITSQDSLKAVKMKNFIPTSDFLDLLSRYLRNITYIICEFDFMYRKKDNQAPGHILVDISNFKNLRIFYFDLQLLCKDDSSVCFIKFNYVNGDNCCYQLATVKPIELKLISLEYIQNHSESSSINSITFKCEKIERFVLHSETDVAEINYGGFPNFRAKDFGTDVRFRF